jgi:predicted molibdopterin-dependent oxidoreductase YjgC
MGFVNGKKRLRRPLIRRDGVLQETSWDEALDYIAGMLPSYKGSRFAILTAPDSTNEEHYLAQKFARTVMVTNNVGQTSNTRPELVTGLMEALGYGAATNPTWELEDARCILAFNANVTEEHNVLGVPIKRAVKGGAKLVVIDPREVELTRYAHLWLRPRPGTELLLLGGMLKTILDEGLDDGEWVDEQCLEIDGAPGADLRRAVESVDLGGVARETGVSQEQIMEAARVYAGSGASAIVYALDNVPRQLRGDCVLSLADMALLTHNLGRPSTGLYPLRQGANEQGAWDMGCVPHLLPGYRRVDDADGRRHLEDVWGEMVPIEPGLDLRGIFDSVRGGEVKAMFIVGDSLNLAEDGLAEWSALSPDAGPLSLLDSLDLLVVQDHFLGPVARKANVVLPRCTFAEKEGTFTNIERRVQYLRPVISLSNSEAQPEWWTISQIGRRMAPEGFDFASPEAIMDEAAGLVPLYGGISHRRLQAEGVLVARPDPSQPLPIQLLYSDKEYAGLQWPCPDADHPGASILYVDGFPEDRPRLLAPDFRAVEARQDAEYPFLLVPGRVLLQSQRELEIVNGRANSIQREEVVEISSADAESLGIQEGDPVEVRTSSGLLQGRSTIREDLQSGIVSSTALFGQLAVDLQASDEPDPMSRVPGLNITPAMVKAVVAVE